MRRLLLLFLFVNPFFISAQVITTFAGNGISGHTGDGGDAVTAEITNPVGGVFDSKGNYYFAGYDNTVRKVDTSGIISTIAGNGIAGFSGDGGQAINAE